ncbi:tRNA pseudouridine(55) synthase TruB [Fluviicola taffensis]|uniref:tRNA pseudouridine synthase B n=1 Tax=Fluviicola taffensis (strain DSM 16823 / NCIMB 13979 / RW262) TaxID=755732 RepID=F2IK26_FLUTR|nr:tRNA pseudouridine(55) synthase TruB [Fluviicola taffensis]AEA42925.1 tRNA pseudouridine synthase B [Fluviicola taffensis DSM 16823]
MITEFSQGSTILVDKPLKWTSFDAVNKLRWHLRQKLGVKKLKVGHAGTLDPLATGLLVICIGKHTKLIEGLTSDTKTYTGTFLLGKTTPSYDLETKYNSEKEPTGITSEQLEEVRLSFLGVQQQVPPLFSAKQIDGKRAYDYARAGIEKELKANAIEIMDFQIDSTRFPEIDFEISCSKGTYIRSIAHDFGQKLECGATLIALRRTRSGIYDIKDSKSVEEWISFIEEQPL